MLTQDLLVSSDKGILTIRFNRPQKKNAFTIPMYETMTDALAQAHSDPEIHSVLFCGSSEIFTAGNDLAFFLNEATHVSVQPIIAFLRTITDTNKLILAAVSGPAIGIGTTLLLHCDFVYASPTARFHLPFAQLGLTPEAASSLLLPRLMGMRKATELLLLGKPFDCLYAMKNGLINGVVADDELEAHTIGIAQQIGALPREAVLQTKALLKSSLRATIHETIDQEAVVFEERLASKEAKVILQKFLSK